MFENMSVSLSQRRRFGKGAVVYQQGSPAQLFYIVNEGELEMSTHKPDGGSSHRLAVNRRARDVGE